ncbi:MAG: sugar ABC transporter substrate-binding protein [Lachnospiraceae bacterium]|nr:sugar ABC transporter substrate-binding protein [Lachnospiraceae bacterium]
MKKRLLALTLGVSMTAGLLSGCGGGSNDTPATTPADNTTEAPAADEGTDTPASDNTAAAGEFNWKAYEGTQIDVLFSEHTYADAVEAKLADFEALTGIKVNYSSMPESNYFDKLNVELSSHSGTPDVFMTGAYQSWEYASAGNMEPLENYISDASLTNPDYDYADFIPGVIDALKWDCVPGHKVGSGSQWALPMGWEINILTYNKDVLAENNLEAPKTAEELLNVAKSLHEFNGSGTYGLALRGTADWGTIHPAYMSMYSTWGAKDFEVVDGKLVSQVDSPEAIAMTDYWVQLVKEGGAPQWSTYGWELAGADLGARKAAMMWDADRGGYTQNVAGASAEAGNLAFGMIPYPESAGKTEADMKSNLWTWSMAMNADSSKKEAAWYFMQYFTGPEFMLWSGTEGACTDTPRQSVLESEAYKAAVADAEGYFEAFSTLKDTASIFFTPHPYFSETTTEWAKTLQDLVVSNKYSSTEEAMKQLKETMDAIVSDLDVE